MTRAQLFVAGALAVALASLLGGPSARAASPFGSARAPEAPPPSREFASDDLPRAQRLAIAALQDLGFALESADAERGTLSASRLDTHPLRLSITLRAASASTIAVSVATEYAGHPVADPRAAEAFFAALAAQLAPERALD